jgi:hypothetical protein
VTVYEIETTPLKIPIVMQSYTVVLEVQKSIGVMLTHDASSAGFKNNASKQDQTVFDTIRKSSHVF